jgi:hypothetical protein
MIKILNSIYIYHWSVDRNVDIGEQIPVLVMLWSNLQIVHVFDSNFCNMHA